MPLDPLLKKTLTQIDENTSTIKTLVNCHKGTNMRLEVLEKGRIIKADMDIFFQDKISPLENDSRGKMFEDEVKRLIKRFNIKSLKINYEG